MAKITNWRANRILFDFDNGFKLSVVFGFGSYSDNHNVSVVNEHLINRLFIVGNWDEHIESGSENVEIMFSKIPKGGERLVRAAHKKYSGDGSVIGYLPVSDLYKIITKIDKFNSEPLKEEKNV